MEKEIKKLRARLNFFIGLAMLFIIAFSFMIFQIMNSQTDFLVVNSRHNNTLEEKNLLIQRLKGLRSDYEEMNTNYKENLDSVIGAQKVQVTAMLDKIEGMRISDITQREKILNLQKQLSLYLVQIQSLQEKNNTLSLKYNEIKISFDSLFNTTIAHSQRKESIKGEISNAATLKAYEIRTMTYRVENGKDQLSRKANKINKAKIFFKLTDNRTSMPGVLKLYCRISKPGDDFSTANSKNLLIDGNNIHYTFEQTIDYTGKPTDICLSWECNRTLSKGAYTADLYSENQFIGQSLFILD